VSAGAYLAFDAATPRSVVAVGMLDVAERGARLLASDDEDDGANQASSRLVPRIEAVLRRAGVAWPGLVAVACGCGPGTFTGTRVAVATAQGIALGRGLPVVPVSTLAAQAASLDAGGRVLAVLDARRDEVYAAAFDCDPTAALPLVDRVGDEVCAPLGEVLARELGEIAHVVGPGVAAYADAVDPRLRARAVAMTGPTPLGLWRATVAAAVRGDTRDAAALDAVYLRKSYAELGLNTPKRARWHSPFV
jgi:tRNA threonylcarbamoyl adenosine modification protein YeaZ